MYICSFPIMHVGKYVIEKNWSCLKKHNYLAGQKWPVTSQVVRISLQLFFFNKLFQKQFFCTQQLTDVWWPRLPFVKTTLVNLLISDSTLIILY